MKDFIVTAEFEGLTGAYRSRIEVSAKNTKSAEKKARGHFGNRPGFVVSVVEMRQPKDAGERLFMLADGLANSLVDVPDAELLEDARLAGRDPKVTESRVKSLLHATVLGFKRSRVRMDHNFTRTECGNQKCTRCGCHYGPSVMDVRINGPWAYFSERVGYETKKDPGCVTTLSNRKEVQS